jgi:excisionase family DNA binding protein
MFMDASIPAPPQEADSTPRELFSVEQVATQLGLHVRTIRKYVREGRLHGVRIGKQYRIAREDIESLTGQPVTPSLRESVRRERHIEVSSIIQIEAISPEVAGRITNGLMAAANSREQGDGPLRVDTIYDEARGRMKVIVTGGISPTTSMLRFVALYLEQP